MADKVSKETRSRIMSRIRSKGTRPERMVSSWLREKGIRVRHNCSTVPGKPDIALVGKKRALFIDGDFWHGYRFGEWRDRLPPGYWPEKIQRNIERDRRVDCRLQSTGWLVMRVWEHDLEKDFEETIAKIIAFLTS